MTKIIICVLSLIFVSMSPVKTFPTQEELQLAKEHFGLGYKKLIEKWFVNYSALTSQCDNPFTVDVIEDRENLISSLKKWKKAEAFVVDYKREYAQKNQELLQTFLGHFLSEEDRVAGLQVWVENDRADPLMQKLFDLELSIIQKVIEMIDFILIRHGEYTVQNGQILLFTSEEQVEIFNYYSQEVRELTWKRDNLLASFN